MRVAVVVEQGWDPASIEVDPVRGEPDWSRAAPAPAPGSLEAVELGLGLGSVTVYALGEGDGLPRRALAMGCEAAWRAGDLDALVRTLESDPPDLVLCPSRAGDGGPSALAGAIAGRLDLPQATRVESISISEGEIRVRRRLDRGEREDVALAPPAVLAIEPGVAQPRPVSPAALLAARAATVAALPAGESRGPRPRLVAIAPPRPPAPRMAPPDPEASAASRIEAVLGGSGEIAERTVIRGSTEEVAERIVRFLRDRGHLG